MNDIDPVEAILAVIGVHPLISREVERVTMEQVHAAHDLPKTIYKEAKGIVAGEKSSVPLGAVNYKKAMHALTEEYTEQQLNDMVKQFPPALHAITSQFTVKADETLKVLRSILPLQVKQTLLGPENILPSALAVRRFAVALDVLDDPMRVLAHIACGSLLKSQAAIVQHVYPTISAAIEQALKDAGADAKADKKSFTLPPMVTIGWAAWKQQPRVSQGLQKRLQDNFVQAREAKQNAPTQPASGQSIVAKEALSNTQRALYPSTSKAG